MTERGSVAFLRATALLGAILGIVGTVAIPLTGADPSLLLTEGGAFFLFSLFYATAVWFVAPRQSRNPVVWIMAATSFFAGLYNSAWALVFGLTGDLSIVDRYVPADNPTWVALIFFFILPIATGGIVTQLTFGLLLFPDGRLPSERWQPVGWFSAGVVVLIIGASAWDFRPGSTEVEGGGTASQIAAVLMLVAALLAVLSLAGRFRRSTGVTRQQLKWVLWGASLLVLSLIVLQAFMTTVYEELFLAVFAMAGGAFVASYGIALGKYRLYDIDVVISRTMVYGVLAVFITGVYVAAVVGVGGLLGNEESHPWLSIGATALVALAFEPLRERLQRFANRLIYGKRATPYEVLSEFSRKITAGDEALLEQVARSLAEGTTASQASVWVRHDGLIRQTAVWPPGEEEASVAIAANGAASSAVDLMVPVSHDGEALGALTLTAARGQTLLPMDQRLVEQVASGMGLALRNIRLGEDLRSRIDSLHQSRQRLVTVQDETRRHLERQLHDGVQQRLVGLKVRLALVRTEAEASGVGQVADLLGGVATETDQAIDLLRDFARGIYPPLLEAEGPAAALASQVLKLPIEVTVHAAGVGRHPRPVEAAVYFCVLEALQNVVKHARASSAHVAIHEREASLDFEVSDDGKGFDPAKVQTGSGLTNLADRLDALDGRLGVDSAPGRGTTVRGSIPTRLLQGVR
jgi:signal transduction histidine kinase